VEKKQKEKTEDGKKEKVKEKGDEKEGKLLCQKNMYVSYFFLYKLR
jgi:hypothetical protein